MNYINYLYRKVLGIDIVKIFSLNAISTLVRMLAGLISVKVVAVIIGPAGVALMGQLNSFNTILLSLANGGISNGIIKYVSENKADTETMKKILSAALRITLFFTVIVAVLLVVFHGFLSLWIFQSDKYGYVFVVFGFTIILYSLNVLLLAVLNGYKDFKRIVTVNICGTVLGLIYSIILVVNFGLSGAMINAVTFQSVMFFVTLWMCRKCVWMEWSNFRERIDVEWLIRYMKYSLMTLISIMLVPVSQIILRGYVIADISITEAGWWEGMNRISAMYLSVITASFSVYYLPKLSEIKDNVELRREIYRCYKFIVPFLVIVSVTLYFLRNFIVWLLFTPDFYPMEQFFLWQFLGDFFKICSWLLAYLMVAKAMTKYFIVTEVVFAFSNLLFSFLLMKVNGTVGLTQGYLLNYILYFGCMVFLFRKVLFIKNI